ncbi:uncharacterized protein SPPG_09201 [Spizellomyces punctatus DAOM BR117]|uniref:Uncharacterized protein n=1 Tax=Spizellomyces punctatus (strain DAOM BR117) TaxID=645134 RepID=A0A0L0HGI2_SPIPD|nr:uncharacterized protein SPPG_09201 [Spizellomyces punctatus DAOM BR117]KND00203.1 hypothetical protein SPPG_09201 [Spizellomyces punctatus DAOM BR117]|eukprot:XP_016608242.1 hypothetical protein SPPG_09201 [Spizellomyces punctatus DAOM BR117]
MIEGKWSGGGSLRKSGTDPAQSGAGKQFGAKWDRSGAEVELLPPQTDSSSAQKWDRSGAKSGTAPARRRSGIGPAQKWSCHRHRHVNIAARRRSGTDPAQSGAGKQFGAKWDRSGAEVELLPPQTDSSSAQKWDRSGAKSGTAPARRRSGIGPAQKWSCYRHRHVNIAARRRSGTDPAQSGAGKQFQKWTTATVTDR